MDNDEKVPIWEISVPSLSEYGDGRDSLQNNDDPFNYTGDSDWNWAPQQHSSNFASEFSHHLTFCRCSFCRLLYSYLPVSQAPSATISAPEGNRNEASPPQPHEMESSNGADTLAAQAASFPENPYTDQFERGGMILSPKSAKPADVAMVNGDESLFQTPDPSRYVEHSEASNVRESVEEQQSASGPDSEARVVANILANGAVKQLNGEQSQSPSHRAHKLMLELLDEETQETGQLPNSFSPTNDMPNGHPLLNRDIDPKNAKAFAKLVFPDGDFFITTHDVMLGRNMDVFERIKRQKKAQKKARDTLDSYRQEPSQPSQPGDEDQQGHPSNSSQSLEGRPAPPSNISEHGGMVSYQAHSDGEVDTQRAPKRKRRSLQVSKSSSTTSIAPASLHPSAMPDVAHANLFTADGEPEFRTYAFIPVHTQIPEHITRISKEHLMFYFNFKEERWELHVVGNRAFVNDYLFEKGDVVALEHNDEILIASVNMTFKLPDNFRHSPGLSRGTFSKASEDEADEASDEDAAIGTSPIRRLSNAMEAGESGEDKNENEVENGTVPEKLKIKLKKSGKASHKRSKKDSPLEPLPEATKKAEKSKKPKAAAKETAGKEEIPSPPSAPPQIEPGSVLDGIPVEELPQKRKGPGRPPKNGLVSKRDQSMVSKKTKELEKRGEKVPSYDYLVQLVRAENKAKERQAKMLADGQLPPDVSILQSIETETSPSLTKVTPGQPKDNAGYTSAMPAEPIRRGSPRPKRTGRSLSPFKPESEYTEEDLKKPTETYVYILDKVLRDHGGDKADLQDIYHLVAKRHPYFEYRVPTKGWQSSIRHNLLQHDRFMEVGKSGKGRFWRLNPDVSIEKEKKRKVTPPPRPPMQNGQYMQQPHFGQTQYGNPYAQPHPNGPPQFNSGSQPGSSTYYSPYAQPGQNHGHVVHGQPGSSSNQTHAHPTQHPQQQPKGPQSAKPLYFDDLVSEIMAFRLEYLQPFMNNKEEYPAKINMFQRVTTYLSDVYENSKSRDSEGTILITDEEKTLATMLEVLFRKHQPQMRTEAKAEVKVEPTESVQQAVNQAVENENTSSQHSADAITAQPLDQTDAITATIPAHSMVQTSTEDVIGTAPSIKGEGSAALASQGSPANAGSSGRKRAADEIEDEPDAKRAKE